MASTGGGAKPDPDLFLQFIRKPLEERANQSSAEVREFVREFVPPDRCIERNVSKAKSDVLIGDSSNTRILLIFSPLSSDLLPFNPSSACLQIQSHCVIQPS
jgi:hypothetical protein